MVSTTDLCTLKFKPNSYTTIVLYDQYVSLIIHPVSGITVFPKLVTYIHFKSVHVFTFAQHTS